MVSARLRIQIWRTSELITIWITDVDSIDHFKVKSSLLYAVPLTPVFGLESISGMFEHVSIFIFNIMLHYSFFFQNFYYML